MAVIVVPLTVLAVVPPIAGGADKSNVPPNVKLPVLVTVPDKLIPDTVPVPLTDVTVPTVGVAQVGTPAAKVNTWPLAPTARKEVAPAAVWYGIDPNAPPAKFVAVVAVVAVPALPETEPVIVLVTVKSSKVPKPVMPVYAPDNLALSIVPLVTWLAAIAMLALAANVNWPWAFTVNVATWEAEP